MAFVYILRTASGKYYIGSTINLEQRMRHHQAGGTQLTRRLRNPELALAQKYDTLKQARYVEFRLKKLKRRDYIEKIIQDGYIKIE